MVVAKLAVLDARASSNGVETTLVLHDKVVNTSRLVAGMRAIESARSESPFFDSLAGLLAGEDIIASIRERVPIINEHGRTSRNDGRRSNAPAVCRDARPQASCFSWRGNGYSSKPRSGAWCTVLRSRPTGGNRNQGIASPAAP